MAEGRVRWAFWAPGTDPSTVGEGGDGIWIRDGDDVTGAVGSESDGEEGGVEQDGVSESDDEEGSEADDIDLSDEEEGEPDVGFGGRFGALALEDAGAESTEEE